MMSDPPNPYATQIRTRHILYFDGTDNSRKSGTNIHRLMELTYKGIVDGAEQCPVYWEGVGVTTSDRAWEKITQFWHGSLFGTYSWNKLRSGYIHLAHKHKQGDEIFIFGFSRGAFQAMGLAGLLEWRGLPKPDVPSEIMESHIEIYRNATQNSKESCQPGGRSISELMDLCDEDKARLHEKDKEVLRCFRPVGIEFLGLFDTVRAYGAEVGYWFPSRVPREVPETEISISRRGTLALRYTRHLPPNVIRAYHALAVDEHRAAFHTRVWIIPRRERKPPTGREVEQRWFIGAHANVGGGYDNDPLSKISLSWMQEKAVAKVADENGGSSRRGIKFNEIIGVVGNEYKAKSLVDSRLKHPKSAGSSKPFCRPIWALEASVDKKTGNKINCATIDHSVLERIRDCESYRPRNVEEFLRELRQERLRDNKVSSDDGLIQECLERFDATRRNSSPSRPIGMLSRVWERAKMEASRLLRILRE